MVRNSAARTNMIESTSATRGELLDFRLILRKRMLLNGFIRVGARARADLNPVAQ